MMYMHLAFIQVGTNSGDRHALLTKAKEWLDDAHITILESSSIYETAAWGPIIQPDFLNQLLRVNTSFTPDALMDNLLAIEEQMGRIRAEKMGPRIIDLDIIFYDNVVLHSEKVIIPHPLLQERKFILQPMAELNPAWIHPVLKKPIVQLLAECKDPLPVKKWIPQQNTF